jgi:hypothetical protein
MVTVLCRPLIQEGSRDKDFKPGCIIIVKLIGFLAILAQPQGSPYVRMPRIRAHRRSLRDGRLVSASFFEVVAVVLGTPVAV